MIMPSDVVFVHRRKQALLSAGSWLLDGFVALPAISK